MWYIVTEDGIRHQITEKGVTIGREGCVILTPIADARVSRLHATVRLQGNYVEVLDMDSTNGTYIEEQRLRIATPWTPGQILRCGQTYFQLIQEVVQSRSAQTMVFGVNQTFISQDTPDKGAEPAPVTPAFQPVIQPPQASFSPIDSNQNISTKINYQNPQFQGTFSPDNATNSAGAINGIVFGVIMLIVGIIGWQHYLPQINNMNSLLGQFAVAFGGEAASRQVQELKLYYIGSIVLACVGGITVLASAIRLAVIRK